MQCPDGLPETIASTIGVKQECPLSPTLFRLYIDEIVDIITQGGGGTINTSGTPAHIMQYVDNLILVSESREGLKSYLQALEQRGYVNCARRRSRARSTMYSDAKLTAILQRDTSPSSLDTPHFTKSWILLISRDTVRGGRQSQLEDFFQRSTPVPPSRYERGAHFERTQMDKYYTRRRKLASKS